MTPHFRRAELACRHCGLVGFHPGFLEELEATRVEFGRPMRVRSCCRCKVHNDRPAKEGGAGGHSRSLHVFDKPGHLAAQGTLAIDIEAVDGAYRGDLFVVMWRRGWSVGWNAKQGFLHGDRRDFIGMPRTSFDY